MQPRILVFLSCLTLLGCASNTIKSSGESVTIYFNGKTPFSDEALIKQAVKEECELPEYFANAIIERAALYGIILKSDRSLANTKGLKELRVEIASADPGITVFGNLGTVPATSNVRFTLWEDNKLFMENHKECSTKLAGFMGLQSFACDRLHECADRQAEYIARTIKVLVNSKSK